MSSGLRSGARRAAALWALLALGCHASSSDAPGSVSAPICVDTGGALGPSPLRRLTRFEYGRTMQDLAGVAISVADSLPPDERSQGFDNMASAYSVSTLHASKYLEVAEQVSRALLSDPVRLSYFAGCDPKSEPSCVEPFLQAFGRRAYRRPLQSDELDALLALHEKESRPDSAAGLDAVLTAMLQSPQFLYRPEFPASGEAGAAPLDAFALASRLSYLIVASAPDETLLSAAERGSLDSEAGLDAAAERLLAQPEAVTAFSHFVEQWWDFESLPGLEKDRGLFRQWSAELPAAFAQETRLFLEDAWSRGPTLRTLLASPSTFVDQNLATFYGYPLPNASGFQRVTLDPARAAGLLTQGAFLATHAKPNQSSPVHRGKFVRAQLFCMPPPPPPPDIVVKPPNVDPRLSTRERFLQHEAEPACANCHQLMDPIGFAFEHFDATGRYREVDAGKPVDATGMLMGTDVDGPLDGVVSLSSRLVESAQVRKCVATQWFRYAFGRNEQSAADTCTIDALAETLQRQGGDLRRMIKATVGQSLFRLAEHAAGAP